MVLLSILLVWISTFLAAHSQTRNVKHSNTLATIPNISKAAELISAVNVPALQTLLAILQESKEQFKTDNDNQKCQGQTLFTNQLIGLMNIAIWRNNLFAVQSVAKVQEIDKNMSTLRGKIDELKMQQKAAEERAISLNLTWKLNLLENIYREYKGYDEEINQLIGKIAVNSQESEKLMMDVDLHRTSRAEKQLQQKLTSIQIQRLEKNINLLKEKKRELDIQIQEEDNIINNNKFAIEKVSKQNLEYEDKIHELELSKQEINKEILELQFQIPKIEAEMQRIAQLRVQLDQQIQAAQIKERELKVDYEDIVKPEELTFQNIQLSQLIQQLYPLSTQTQTICFADQSTSLYYINSKVIQGKHLFLYLRNIYSNNIVLPQSTLMGSFKFLYIDLYGRDWTSYFGYPFGPQEFVDQYSLILRDDPTCGYISLTNTIANNGRIVMITNRSIYIRDTKDRNMKLMIGGCTKIESQLKIPKEGNTVYFKGTQRKIQKDDKIFEIDVLMMTIYE